MLRNFFKITFRNFSKNKSYVFINLIGMGLSIALCIVGYLNYKYAADFDKHHENHGKIFKVHSNKTVQDRKVPYGITPLPLGEAMKDRVAGVKYSSRYTTTGMVLKKELKVFDQGIAFGDDEFLQMFTYPLKYGNREAFLDASKLILAEDVAESYFGDTDPTGELILAISDDGREFPMTIGGVFEKIPNNSSLRFDALTHFDNYFKFLDTDRNNWEWFVAGTFVMTDGSYPEAFLNDINNNFIEIQNAARNDFLITDYYLVPLADISKYVEDIRSHWHNWPPPPPAVTVPFMMSFVMLLIACFNFTNTSIAVSSKRLKEIGVRKVMGGSRKQLIVQFMGENLILSFGALLIGVAIALYLTPVYSAMWDFINLKIDFLANPEIFGFLLALLIAVSIIAGGYPSLYISAYEPVKILRGSLSLGGTNWFSKILLGLQYLFTIVALISSLAFSNNARYQSTVDVGFQMDNIMSVRVDSQSEYERFYNTIEQMPEISELAGTTHHVGAWTYSRTLRNGEEEIESDMMNLGINYANMMGLTMVEGRYFDSELYEADRANSIIVNETLVGQMKWDDPIGKVVQVDDSTRLAVIGVMKDFYMDGFFNPVDPTAFRLSNKEDMNFVVLKSEMPSPELRKLMENKWYEVAPNAPFEGYFVDESMAEMELVNTNIVKMFGFQGLLALLLSSIGLYTLVSLNVIKKVKEIGVRKVLGASVNQILVMMNRQFFWLLFIASVLGAVVSYFLIDALMASIFSVYKAISVPTVLIPFVVLIGMALTIASTRILKSATQNPVKSLRYE